MTAKRKRTRRAPERWPQPMWKVRLDAHRIEPRWDIPAWTVELGAPSAESACATAVRWSHIDAGVPPLRRFVAASMQHAHAVPMRSPTARSEAA